MKINLARAAGHLHYVVVLVHLTQGSWNGKARRKAGFSLQDDSEFFAVVWLLHLLLAIIQRLCGQVKMRALIAQIGAGLAPVELPSKTLGGLLRFTQRGIGFFSHMASLPGGLNHFHGFKIHHAAIIRGLAAHNVFGHILLRVQIAACGPCRGDVKRFRSLRVLFSACAQ